MIARLVRGVELLGVRGNVRHSETFSFGDYLKDCDMSATLRDIGATFSAIAVTKCDMAPRRLNGEPADGDDARFGSAVSDMREA